MEEPPPFGLWLKQLRAERDLTQEMLAEEVACAVQTVRAIENGQRRPSRAMAARLADVLQVPAVARAAFLELARRGPAPTPAVPGSMPAAAPASPRFRPALPLTSLIGREAELAELRILLTGEEVRLVTLLGPGGIGKSRLALQVACALADEYEDGALWIALAQVNQPDAIPLLLAEAMGATLDGTQTAVGQVTSLLAGRRLLLVLDNFEQLLDAGAGDAAIALVEHALRVAPDVRMLVTSRERLRLAGEQVFVLEGLTAPPAARLQQLTMEEIVGYDAVMLFLERARQVDRRFVLNAANCGDVAHICALLQGIPLGIELAAAWMRVLNPQEIATEISASIDFLALADRNLAPRHRSMRAVFDHSWALLRPDERHVLARLAVFRGGFDRAAAKAVAGASLPQLALLVDKSLVRRMAGSSDDGGQPVHRYDLHELLRQYALDKLGETDQAHAVEAAHARYFAALAERWVPYLLQPDPRPTVQALEREQGNLRAAIEWCIDTGADPTLGLQLAAALGRFWYLSEQWREGRDWLQKALHAGGDNEEAQAFALTYLGEIHHSLSEHSAGTACLDEAIARWRRLDRPEPLAWALLQAGSLAATMGRHAIAQACFEESLALYRSVGNRVRAAFVAVHLSSSHVSNARYAEAAQILEESLAVFRASDYQGTMVVSLNLLGRALVGMGSTGRAITLFEEALALSTQRKSQSGATWALLNLGLTFALQQEFDQSAHYYRRTLDAYVALGRRGGALAVLDGLAAAMAARGAASDAVQLMAATARLRSEIDESLSEQENAMRNAALAHAQQLLSATEWQAAWRQGESLTFERAVLLAKAN